MPIDVKKTCTGCGACLNACPANAIEMKENIEGFFYPAINESICTKCEKCKKVCSIQNIYNDKKLKEPICYAFASEDCVTTLRGSGGIFTILAEEVLNNQGIVYGAAYNESFMVSHVAIDKISDLDRIRLSKYVQSDIGLTLKDVKNNLKNNKLVLFAGTPCQIEGLNLYLKNEGVNTTKLITVDLICYGVPSPGVYKNYLETNYEMNQIKEIIMRRKDGWTSCFDVIFKDGTEIKTSSTMNPYQLAFHQDLIVRDSCIGCKYSRLPRCADISIGDFWNAKKLKMKEIFKGKCSVVLANSHKGDIFLKKSVANSQYDNKLVSLKSQGIGVEKLNKNIYKPGITERVKKDIFYHYYTGNNLNESLYKTIFPKGVGLILYMSDNYGSCATNYALYKVIESLGHTPIIFDNIVPIKGVSKEFASKYLTLASTYFEKNDYSSANLICDSFVIGSDQSLRWDFGLVSSNYTGMLLAFVDNNKRKISYAASFGPDRELNDPLIKKMYTRCLKDFDYFSVREDYAVEMSKREFNCEAEWVIDPVFLVDCAKYETFIAKSKSKRPEHYLLAYLRYYSSDKLQLLQNKAKSMNLEIVIICDANSYSSLTEKYGEQHVIDKPSFIDWLSYYYHADYIVTDSFHGTCFSIIFHKNFISIKAGTKQRFDSLVKILGFTDSKDLHIIEDDELSYEGYQPINYALVDKSIDTVKEKCIDWLKDALTKKISPKDRIDTELLIDYTTSVKQYVKANNELDKIKNNIKE